MDENYRIYIRQARSTQKAALEHIETSGTATQQDLVEAHLLTVPPIAWAFSKRFQSLTLMDFIQAGNCGLMEAAKRYDPAEGTKFSTYSHNWIIQRMQMEAALNCRTVRISRPMHIMVGSLTKHEREHDGLSVKELAEKYDTTEAFIREAQVQMNGCSLSLDFSTSDGENDTNWNGYDFLADDEDYQPDNLIERHQIPGQLDTLFARLNPRDADIVARRWGLNGYEPQPNHVIGEVHGASKQRIDQLYVTAMASLACMAQRGFIETWCRSPKTARRYTELVDKGWFPPSHGQSEDKRRRDKKRYSARKARRITREAEKQ